MGVRYTEGVFRDRNPVKRWLQQQRPHSAIGFAQKARESVACVLDSGAGSGELCKHLVHAYPSATIICYEPCPDLLEEARIELERLPRVEFHAAFDSIRKAGWTCCSASRSSNTSRCRYGPGRWPKWKRC